MKDPHASTVGRIGRLTGQLTSMTQIRAVLFTSAWMLSIAGCAGIESQQPLSTVPSVNLARYAGTWYEIARLPMWFQRHCVDSKAVYAILPNNKVHVHNECVTDSGTLDQVDGVATVVDSTTNARLAVVFDNFFARLVGPSREGNYWIIDLDPDYQVAMVGTPDRRYLWILSRTPNLDMTTYQGLMTKAQNLGFPVSKLIKTKRPDSGSASSRGFPT
jgi:apolipoprotein D and lipocalin family protein